MGATSGIEWTNRTWNPVAGCTRVSAGCDHCYAAREAATRLKHTRQYRDLAVLTPGGRAAFNGTIRLLPERLDEPLRWTRPRRVFVNSMSDLFHEGVPDDYIASVFAVMAAAFQHTFQVLTKRPLRMRDLLSREDFWTVATMQGVERWWGDRELVTTDLGVSAPLSNVWLGVSTEDQVSADERIPLLLATPAAVRFVSAEPLLGPVRLVLGSGEYVDYLRGVDTHGSGEDAEPYRTPHLDWVIVGGESGPGARPMNLAWARDLVTQCRAAGVAVFVKQLGARPIGWEAYPATHHLGATGVLALAHRKGGDPAEWPADLRVREYPKGPA